MPKKKKKGSKPVKAEELRGQLMLQIAAGRFFRAGVPLNERPVRRTLYSNGFFDPAGNIELPVGTLTGATDFADVTTVMVEVLDRLEAKALNGDDELLIATGGHELVDDLTYVVTFALNVLVDSDHDRVTRLIKPVGAPSRRTASSLFPKLFDGAQYIAAARIDDLRAFMDELLALPPEDFARVMRVIRASVDAVCRAIDDPTGAYTDLVAALESLAGPEHTTPFPWSRYDGRKRKIFDTALEGQRADVVEKVRAAALEADHAGLKRQFVASTLARATADYFRGDADGTVNPPRQPDLERMLGIAYDIRSHRSHVLEDLGEEAWGFTDGAETTWDPRLRYILTLAGLWRLVRHVVRRYVATAPKVPAEPWDYRGALPGIIRVRLAPQYWVSNPAGLTSATAPTVLNGVIGAFIDFRAGTNSDSINLSAVAEHIEHLVPGPADGEQKTALIAIHVLWHRWTDPAGHRPAATALLAEYAPVLDAPSPIAYAVTLFSGEPLAEWTTDQWVQLASRRHEARVAGKESPLPATVDALIQMEAAAKCETDGRHDEALTFAANAVGEIPGNRQILDWEQAIITSGDFLKFDTDTFLYGARPEPDTEGDANADANADDGQVLIGERTEVPDGDSINGADDATDGSTDRSTADGTDGSTDGSTS